MKLKTRYNLTPEHAKKLIGASSDILAKNPDYDMMLVTLGKQLGYASSTVKRKLWYAQRVLDNNFDKSSIVTTSKTPIEETGPPQAETPADPIEVRRLREKLSQKSSALKNLEVRLVKAEDIRSQVLALGDPVYTKIAPSANTAKHGRRSVILHISDIQYGELIDPSAIDGVNSYSLEIANLRIQRYFKKSYRFMTELWHGEKVDKIIVLLNGDMISGALHQELDRTDEQRPLVAAKLVAEQLSGGIAMLRKIGAPVSVICTPGNHGRMTLKPESKSHVLQNYDTLVGWFVEAALKHDTGVRVLYSESVDALFSEYDFPMLVTHGDRIGSRGGTGFLGATATILRGHHKVFTDYAVRGINLYKIFTGHFHTPAETVWGYANNTMAGWNEYARDGRMMPTPAAQGYFVIHEELGIIENRQIMVGSVDEGTSHRPVAKYRD